MDRNGNQDMKSLADSLWEYMKPKVENTQTNSVRYFRAKVTANPGRNQLTVQRPFDNTQTLPCVPNMAGAAVGDEVTVLIMGNNSNATVVGTGSLSNWNWSDTSTTSAQSLNSISTEDLDAAYQSGVNSVQ